MSNSYVLQGSVKCSSLSLTLLHFCLHGQLTPKCIAGSSYLNTLYRRRLTPVYLSWLMYYQQLFDKHWQSLLIQNSLAHIGSHFWFRTLKHFVTISKGNELWCNRVYVHKFYSEMCMEAKKLLQQWQINSCIILHEHADSAIQLYQGTQGYSFIFFWYL